MDFDDKVLDVFLEKQLQLYPKAVADNREEARDFLEDCMAVLASSVEEVWEYLDDVGVDVESADRTAVPDADEIFPVGDGRYLIVEA